MAEKRGLDIGGEAWLVGKDVCEALKYSNPRKALADHVDAEDKRQGDGVTIRDSIGRAQAATLINESGLYSLALSSKLPSAKRFRRWVTSEVLPSIYRKGGYIVGQERMSDQELLSKALLVAQRNIEERNAQIAKLAPAAEYAQNFLLASGGRLISSIAKDYGMSAQKFNQLWQSSWQA